jgi:hypothetical protein
MIDHSENKLNEPRPYDENVQEYAKWIDGALGKFKATK